MVCVHKGDIAGSPIGDSITQRVVCRGRVNPAEYHARRAGWTLWAHRPLQSLRALRSRNPLSTSLTGYALLPLWASFACRPRCTDWSLRTCIAFRPLDALHTSRTLGG